MSEYAYPYSAFAAGVLSIDEFKSELIVHLQQNPSEANIALNYLRMMALEGIMDERAYIELRKHTEILAAKAAFQAAQYAAYDPDATLTSISKVTPIKPTTHNRRAEDYHQDGNTPLREQQQKPQQRSLSPQESNKSYTSVFREEDIPPPNAGHFTLEDLTSSDDKQQSGYNTSTIGEGSSEELTEKNTVIKREDGTQHLQPNAARQDTNYDEFPESKQPENQGNAIANQQIAAIKSDSNAELPTQLSNRPLTTQHESSSPTPPESKLATEFNLQGVSASAEDHDPGDITLPRININEQTEATLLAAKLDNPIRAEYPDFVEDNTVIRSGTYAAVDRLAEPAGAIPSQPKKGLSSLGSTKQIGFAVACAVAVVAIVYFSPDSPPPGINSETANGQTRTPGESQRTLTNPEQLSSRNRYTALLKKDTHSAESIGGTTAEVIERAAVATVILPDDRLAPDLQVEPALASAQSSFASEAPAAQERPAAYLVSNPNRLLELLQLACATGDLGPVQNFQSALAYLSRLEAIKGAKEYARRGRSEIAQAYLQQAKNARESGNWLDAEQFVEKAVALRINEQR